jgi:hypothetical protein
MGEFSVRAEPVEAFLSFSGQSPLDDPERHGAQAKTP